MYDVLCTMYLVLCTSTRYYVLTTRTSYVCTSYEYIYIYIVHRTKGSCIFPLCTSKVTFWRSFPQKLFLRVETWVAPQVEADTSKSGLLSAYECGKGGCRAKQNLKIRAIFGACLELCTKKVTFSRLFSQLAAQTCVAAPGWS